MTARHRIGTATTVVRTTGLGAAASLSGHFGSVRKWQHMFEEGVGRTTRPIFFGRDGLRLGSTYWWRPQ